MNRARLAAALARHERVELATTPTPVERLANLSGGGDLWVKRDDLTGLAFGGNKVRQLEFYLGAARASGADTVVITGAVQSNFVRLAAAAAAKLAMDCHIQLEERVAKSDRLYRESGNVLVDKLLGATIHTYPDGEDEAGADARLYDIADALERDGRKPYVIPLGPGHAPLGALGYVRAALELVDDMQRHGLERARIVVASGSGATHAGLLFALRALGCDWPVTGVCVRRPAAAQRARIIERCGQIGDLLAMVNPVKDGDVSVSDDYLAPGYGRPGDKARRAMRQAARREGLILDPVYTAKTFAAALDAAGDKDRPVIFIHTGGQPALFGYGEAAFSAEGR